MKTPEWPGKPVTWQGEAGGRTLFMSIPFTWNLVEAREFLSHPNMFWESAIVGGPAVKLMPDFFRGLDWVTVQDEMPGVLQRVNPMATRTTEGCTRKCGFCGIGKGAIEPGGMKLLETWPDLPVICDNNILAAPQHHFDKVCDRLEKHGWADFNQGLDARILNIYHAERFKRIGRPVLRLALDHQGMMDEWENAYSTLLSVKVPKKLIHSYALVGFMTGPEEAWQRCEWIEKHNINVLPMWYHALDCLTHNQVSEEQEAWGWTDFERRRLMQWFWKRKKVVR